ncbi:hypothetical protein P4O66_006576 [Electrophorus voltai]|uniref:Uncharacterized protein n=1 Tax=Electrophorus voltai TaxID=2609070 RepID=A0AAD9E0S9_9TELE|nr:hypothetical protein P4O66_006576 [Electrophorus voltai]
MSLTVIGQGKVKTRTPAGHAFKLPPYRMCGMDADLADEEEGEREMEDEFAVGEAVRMLPPPMAHCDGAVWGSRRGPWGCVLWGSVLVLWNLVLVLAGVLLLATIFTLVLMPAMLLLYVGFLCHSRKARKNRNQQNKTRLGLDTNWNRTGKTWSGDKTQTRHDEEQALEQEHTGTRATGEDRTGQ